MLDHDSLLDLGRLFRSNKGRLAETEQQTDVKNNSSF